MKQNKNVKTLVILGLMAAILVVMAYTPLGYLNVGPLAITFNTIPVAIAAVALGPWGGAITGGVFGLTSFLQCFGGSAMGTALFGINPALTVVQCFVPRILDGLIIGFIANVLRNKLSSSVVSGGIVGFCSAFFNTLFYMSSLVLLFGNSDYVKNLRDSIAPGKNVFIFVCLFIGVNAIAEWISTTLITAAVGGALSKARLIPNGKKAAAQ